MKNDLQAPTHSHRSHLITLALLFFLLSDARSQVDERDPESQLSDQVQAIVETFDNSGGLKAYLDYAEENSPAIKAAFHRWQSELHRAGHVGGLPDPIISYGYFVENVETRVGPQNQKFGLKQSFPWFGTLGNRRQVALHAAAASQKRYLSEKLKTYYQVKKAYYEFYFLGKTIEITRDNLELLRFWESIARARYKLSLATHPDVIKAQLELGILEDQLISFEDQVESLAAQLRDAASLPMNRSLPIPNSVSIAELEFKDDSIITLVVRNNPDLAALENVIAEKEAGMQLAGKSSLPDFTLGLDYIEVSKRQALFSPEYGKDAFSISASVSLPIWFGKNSARKKESRARYQAAQYRRDDASNELIAVTRALLYRLSDARRKVLLYRDGLVPKAEQSLNAMYTAYQASETDFLNLLDSQRQLLGFKLQLERSTVTLAVAQAELEMLSGKELYYDNN